MQPKKHIRFDWAIKRLLRQKANFGILEGFLSELLKEDIHILEIIESESNKETEEDKYNRVDILVKDEKGSLIIVEIQNTYAIDYFLRVLYGISKAITEHIGEGKAYSNVKKVVSVNVVYFELGHGSDYVYKGTTKFKGIHDNQFLELTPAQKKLFKKEKIEEVYPEIYLIKVNKFDDNAKDTLDEWIYFLKNSEIKNEFSAKGLKEANRVLQRANMSDKDRREYQRFVEVLSDRASIALTIQFESELLAEKKAEKKAKEKIKAAEAAAAGKVKAAEAAAAGKIKAAEATAAGKIKAAAEKVEKAVEEAVEETIEALIKNTKLSDKDISNALGIDIERVQKIKNKIQ